MVRILSRAKLTLMRSSRPSSSTMRSSFPVCESWTVRCTRSAWQGGRSTGECRPRRAGKQWAWETKTCSDVHRPIIKYLIHILSPSVTVPTVNQELLTRPTMELSHTPVMKVCDVRVVFFIFASWPEGLELVNSQHSTGNVSSYHCIQLPLNAIRDNPRNASQERPMGVCISRDHIAPDRK